MTTFHQFGISFLFSCFTYLAILIHLDCKVVKYDQSWVLKTVIQYTVGYLIITIGLLSWINKELTIVPFFLALYWWIRVGFNAWRNPKMFLQEELSPELEARLNSRLNLKPSSNETGNKL